MNGKKDIVVKTKKKNGTLTERIVVLSDKHPINPGGTTLVTSYEYDK